MNAKFTYNILLFFFVFSTSVSSEGDLDVDMLRLKNGMSAILNKNIELTRGGKFLLKFSRSKVEIFSTNDCYNDVVLVDSISVGDKEKYGESEEVIRYLSYLELSFKDPYGISPKKMIEYYICVLEDRDVTTFGFTGGPNSRGGGPVYLINNKSNKLLEAHYMQ